MVPKSWGVAANNRCEEGESIFQPSLFQIGGAVHADKQRFLYGQNGLIRRLPDSPSGKKILFSKATGSFFMILSPSIGTLHHSLCLLKDNEASSLILCQAGIQIVVYLDDMLLVCTSRELISSRSVSSLAAFLHFRICNQPIKNYRNRVRGDNSFLFTLSTKAIAVALPTVKMDTIRS